jgi:ATP-dependent Clp protease ATP-binding subunit ClpA
MKNKIKVTIFYGPLSWFKSQLGREKYISLFEVVTELDVARNQVTVTLQGHEVEPEEVTRQRLIVAESGDYASLNEHAITNFAGWIRLINPQQLILHNPPAVIHAHIERVFGADVKRHDYPSVTSETLVEIHDGFENHLVGQEKVREQLLAAMYPLTSAERTKPVVLMFYGPSGVGKTETAQFVNGLLGGKLMRKQFSMFHSDKFASYLFGGTHAEASFAHDLLDRESGVILIDEFDKANPVFHSAFYQLFDSGEFEDRNYHVELGPALIICTSNYGSEAQVRQTLGDALYSRFDALIRFEELKPDHLRQIIDKLMEHRLSHLSARESALFDRADLVAKLHRLASMGGNVRKLGKQVDEVISLRLVRSLLDEARIYEAGSSVE